MLGMPAISLAEDDVEDTVPETFFPEDIADPDLGCSTLDADTSFSPHDQNIYVKR